MFSRSIKVGSTRVRVGESRTALEALKEVGNSFANFITGIPNTIGGLISNYGSAGIVGIVALVAILFTIVGGTTLAVKPELTAQLKALPIFADHQTIATQAMNDVAPDVVLVANNQTVQNSDVVADQPSNAGEAAHTVINNKPAAKASDSHQQQWVTNWISKRYRVAGDATNMFVSTAYKTAKETKLDPLLILAVMAIESGFNPFAESPVGAQGLMQVMSKVHHDKFASFGGVQAAMNPTANIKVGSRILSEYVAQGGSIEAGLKKYVGAAAFATDGGYGYRVLAEYKRLQEVATGKNVSSGGKVAPIATTPKPGPAPVVPQTVQAPAKVMPIEATILPIEILTQHTPQVPKLGGDQMAAL